MRKNLKKAAYYAAFVFVSALFFTGCASFMEVSKVENKDFYKNRVFQADKAKEAYFAMMKRFNYPVYPILKTDAFWVCDIQIVQRLE